ncbi:MAG: HEAT repeat domain-containing protein [Planctomycetes bacterium]|nr:HEAT repeat domain-containing protein [Planctomycetota bacterium]
MGISETFSRLRELPAERQVAICQLAIVEPHEAVQLAALETLLDVRGLDRPDVVIEAWSQLLPRCRETVARHRDSLLREARRRMATAGGPERLRACRVIVELGGPGAVSTLVTDLNDRVHDVSDLAARALLEQFRSFAEAVRTSRRDAPHPLCADGWEPSLWAAYETVLIGLPRHRHSEFVELLPEFGAKVVPVLAKVLTRDDDGPIRSAVASVLARSTSDGAIELVLGLAAHHTTAVRELGHEVLSEHDDDAFRRAAARAVVERGDALAGAPWPAMIAPIVATLDPDRALRIVELLPTVADTTGRTRCIEALLGHDDDRVKLAATRLVIAQELPNRASLLAPLVGSESTELRQLAVREVAKVGFSLYLERFDGMAPETRQRAARAVAKIDHAILDRLADEIRSLDSAKRFKALQIVGYLDAGEELRHALMGLLADEDKKVRATALRIVELTGSIPGMKALIDALSDPDRRVRANAIETFASLDDGCYLEIFVPFLDDRDNRVRANAAKALWNVGYSAARDTLASMLHFDDENMRTSAIWALGELRCEGARELLEAREACEPNAKLRDKLAEAQRMLADVGGPT